MPIVDILWENEDKKRIRDTASGDAITSIKYVTNNEYKFYDGIKIAPKERLDEILDSDIRKQYFNFGYYKLDLSNCRITVSVTVSKDGESRSKTETRPVNSDVVEEYKNKEIPCFNPKYHAASNLDINKNHFNLEELYKFVMNHDDEAKDKPSIASRAFTFINNEYSYQLKDEPPIESQDDFHNREYTGGCRPSEAQYPFAHFNLFNKRYINNDKPDELEELGIYNKKENVLNTMFQPC